MAEEEAKAWAEEQARQKEQMEMFRAQSKSGQFDVDNSKLELGDPLVLFSKRF